METAALTDPCFLLAKYQIVIMKISMADVSFHILRKAVQQFQRFLCLSGKIRCFFHDHLLKCIFIAAFPHIGLYSGNFPFPTVPQVFVRLLNRQREGIRLRFYCSLICYSLPEYNPPCFRLTAYNLSCFRLPRCILLRPSLPGQTIHFHCSEHLMHTCCCSGPLIQILCIFHITFPAFCPLLQYKFSSPLVFC